MGLFTDLLSDVFTSFSGREVYADQPTSADQKEDVETEEKKDDGEEKEEGEGEEKEEGDGEEKEEGGDDEGGEDEEEEEEEEEPEDPKPKLEADCAKSAQCAPAKHHFDECVERVHAQHEQPAHKGPKEDCVEEFFHLQHCATQCAAPKLFKILK